MGDTWPAFWPFYFFGTANLRFTQSHFLQQELTNVFCSLPGAIGMYGLAVGISRVGNTLPIPVYSLLSGLNAATVGIIALAAVRLAERAITDRLTRALVYLGGIMGMLFTALWYYPVIMAGAGLTTLIWDLRYPHNLVGLLQRCFSGLPAASKGLAEDLEKCNDNLGAEDPNSRTEKPLPPTPLRPSRIPNLGERRYASSKPIVVPRSRYSSAPVIRKSNLESAADFPCMSWKLGSSILIFFLVTFIASLTLRSVIRNAPRGFSLFANLYLAGTIIFGGGPVVIPLLREYIVTQGWVTPRDFLLGLAIIQAFPGPNFNFGIYLGALAAAGTSLPSFAGALIAFVAVHTPGLIIVLGFMGLWRMLRSQLWFLAILRGVNAAAVGLVYTAVYKLWQIGYLTSSMQSGQPLGSDAWLVAITATAYVGVAWFKINPPLAILLGGAMGMIQYAIIRK